MDYHEGSNDPQEKQKSEKELKCIDCDYITSRKIDLKRHQEAIHKGVKHTCDMCGKHFTDKSNVAQHKKSIHLMQKYDCDLCGYKATTQGHLTVHKLSLIHI